MSGGPDSLALLLLAHAALPGEVEAATVDHGLRPEGAEEARMVAQVCARIGVQHAILTVQVEGGNLQDRARAARYEALAAWLADRGLAALATAHHTDDQAETMLMRLNRGSGLAGLAGVRGKGHVPGSELPLLRPLLGWRRAELAGVVETAGLAAVQDPSNHDDRFDRVRMRKKLAKADWLDPDGIARSAALLEQAEDYVESTLDSCWQAQVTLDGASAAYCPGSSRFENVEIVSRIFDRLGKSARKSDIATLVERLEGGENASLAGLLAQQQSNPDGEGRNARRWTFTPEPPRKVG